MADPPGSQPPKPASAGHHLDAAQAFLSVGTQPPPRCNGTMGNAIIDARWRLIESANENGELANPKSLIGGHGIWRFLTEHDKYYAGYLNYTSAEAVHDARMARTLDAAGPRDMPCILFKPRRDLLNPATQPTGDGSWVYFTDESREMASFLGGQADFGFAGQPNPSANDIWTLRQRYPRYVDGVLIDPTENIDIAWQYNHPADAAVLEAKDIVEIAEEDRVDETRFYEDIGYGIDEHTKLAHDPTNGGECDQTAQPGCNPNYQTRLFYDALKRPKRITLDRAHVTKTSKKGPVKPEPNKLWYWDQYKWVRWEGASQIIKLDKWDRQDVVKLDKWRDQSCARAKWPIKSTSKPAEYPQEQKKYLFELVSLNNGNRPYKDGKSFTKDFNEKFRLEDKSARSENAIKNLVRKMCLEFKKNGKMTGPRPKGPVPKRKKQKEKETVDVEDEEETEEDEELEAGAGPEDSEGDLEDAPGETDDELE